MGLSGSPANGVAISATVGPTLSPTELRQILGANAADLYGFDLVDLAPVAAKVGPTVAEIATPLAGLPDNPNEALLRV